MACARQAGAVAGGGREKGWGAGGCEVLVGKLGEGVLLSGIWSSGSGRGKKPEGGAASSHGQVTIATEDFFIQWVGRGEGGRCGM